MLILIADDNRELRAALRLLLREVGTHVIREAADMGEALAVLRRSSGGHDAVDLVLLDWELPAAGFAGDRAVFVAEVRLAAPQCRVVAMSSRPEAQEEPALLPYPSEYQPPPLSTKEEREMRLVTFSPHASCVVKGASSIFCFTSKVPQRSQSYSYRGMASGESRRPTCRIRRPTPEPR